MQAARFLQPGAVAESWDFKDAFNSEAKLRAALSSAEDDLFETMSSFVTNVVLLDDSGDAMTLERFHPRIDVDKTSSFAELHPALQASIKRLYTDYFFVRQEGLWRARALEKLPALRGATDMLVCGEDLGMVPACVPGVMREMGILSLEVQRMPKDPKILFGHPDGYPYDAVCTTSSHDTSTLRGWWLEDAAVTAKFAEDILGVPPPPPPTCTSAMAWRVVEQHSYSPCAWMILPIQDFMATYDGMSAPDAESERINVPANPLHYWRWRLHGPLEGLLTSSGGRHFLQHLRRLMVASGRLRAYDAGPV